MGQFLISDPQGKKYRITAPEGATADQAMEWGRKQIGAGTLKPQGPAPGAADLQSRVSDIAAKAQDAMHSHTASSTQMEPGKINGPMPTDIIDRKGLPFGTASEIMGADNPNEQLAALRATDPKAYLDKDFMGRPYAVMGDGRKVYVEPYTEKGSGFGGAVKAGATTLGEQAVSRPAEFGGAVLGGVAGGAPGAAVGAGVGYLADQGVKKIREILPSWLGGTEQDLSQKTPLEVGAHTGQAAVLGGAGEAAGRVLASPLRGGAPRWLTGATDESVADSRRLMQQGGTARYKQSAPGLANPEYKVAEFEKLGGKASDNRIATVKEIQDFLAGRNVDPAGAQEITTAAKGGQAPYLGEGVEAGYGAPIIEALQASRKGLATAVGASEKDLSDIATLNDQALQRHQRRAAGLQTDLDQVATADKRGLQDTQRAETATAKAGLAGAKGQQKDAVSAAKLEFDRALDERRVAMNEQLTQQMNAAKAEAERALKTLQSGQGRPVGDLQGTLSEDIRRAQQAYSNHFALRYGLLDKMESGIVSEATPVATAAKNILESMKGPDGNYLVAITDEMAPRIKLLEQLAGMGGQKLPVGQMAALRTSLRELGGTRGLLPSTKQHLVGKLYDAADESIQSSYAGKNAVDEFLTPADAEARTKGLQAVRQKIESDYADYRQKLSDVTAARLVRDAGQRGSVDSENVIDLATRSPSQFRRIWNILPNDAAGQITRQRIGRGIFDDMVGRATRGQTIDAQAFVDQLKGNAPILKQVFGDDARKMVEAANGLLLADGKLPLNNLAPDNVVQALKVATKTQEEMNKYFSKHSLALLSGDAVATDNAVKAAREQVAKATRSLDELKTGQIAAKRGLEDKTAQAKLDLAEQVAQAGQKVSAEGESRIVIGKEKLNQAKGALKDFDQGQFAQLGDETFLKDKAVDYIVRPREEELLNHAFALFGPDSPQVKSLQEAFLKKAIASGVEDMADPKRAFSGKAMRDFLSQYTPKQKRMLLGPYAMDETVPLVGGKTKTVSRDGEQALTRLSEFFDTAFPLSRGGDMAATFRAGGKKGKVGIGSLTSMKGWGDIASYGRDYVKGFLMAHPAAFKLLVTGWDHQYTPEGKAAVDQFNNMLRVYIQSSAVQKDRY